MSYGSWKSPIQSSLLAEKLISTSEIHIDEQGHIYWLESRPSEGGRVVVRSNRDQSDIIPEGFNCRTRVHEYGGGSYTVKNDQLYFSNFADQRIYHIDIKQKSEPKPITVESKDASLRYADFHIDSINHQLICVYEEHENNDVQNSIIAISTETFSVVKLTSGHDFYASPKVSPDGKYLTWVSWNHPNMPWDHTELWVAEIDNNEKFSLKNSRRLFDKVNESINVPCWSADGNFIYFNSDRNGWWNIYRTTVDGETIECLTEMEAEFGGPNWRFATYYFDFDFDGNIISIYWKNGEARLALINTKSKEFTQLTAANVFTDIRALRVFNDNAYFIGTSPVIPSEIVQLNLKTGTRSNLIESSESSSIDSRYLSMPEMITFKTGDSYAHGIYYPPKNDDYQIPDESEELPPLLVRNHGGPTASTTSAYNLRVQYWTSRGFALLDVNYRGSTGYGRDYRNSLKNNWGVYDVDDCVAGAQYLVEQKKVDRKRLTIEGGSAGGYTTLCALTMRKYFSAGASHYGVSDLKALAEDTHKFESRYLDELIGEYPAKKEIYEQRSPINHIANLSEPLIFFQGSEDKIVPPAQAELMVNALREKKLPVAYVLFEGEQHGFRKAENIKRSLDGQLYFFSRIFSFKTADEIEPVQIENFQD